MDLRCFSQPDEKIKLTFYPCSYDMGPGDHCDTCMDTLTVFKTDYTQLLLPYLKSVLPEFDVCWDNRLGREQWNHVIQAMEQDMGKIQFDDTVFDFYTRFAGWITAALELAEGIAVEGNL